MPDHWINRNFIILTVAMLALMYALLYGAALYSYNTSTPQMVTGTAGYIDNLRITLTWLDVAENNILRSICLFVPIGGLIIFAVTMWNTGFTIGQLALFTGFSPALYIFSISIYSLGLIELIAYAVLAAETALFTWEICQKMSGHGNLERFKKHSWKSYLLWLSLLVVSALIEVAQFG